MKSESKATTRDGCLASLPDDKRAALERLGMTIREAAPSAEVCISYQLRAFQLNGKVLVPYGATVKHCSFYAGSGTVMEAHQDDLKGYNTSKGTIRFEANKPLPAPSFGRLWGTESRRAPRNNSEQRPPLLPDDKPVFRPLSLSEPTKEQA